jgi:hypothetical protein
LAQPEVRASELCVVVELVEAVGNEAFVHTRLGAWTLIVRTAPEALPQPGAQLRLYAPWHKIHCFDAASGARVEAPAAQEHEGQATAARSRFSAGPSAHSG